MVRGNLVIFDVMGHNYFRRNRTKSTLSVMRQNCIIEVYLMGLYVIGQSLTAAIVPISSTCNYTEIIGVMGQKSLLA